MYFFHFVLFPFLSYSYISLIFLYLTGRKKSGRKLSGLLRGRRPSLAEKSVEDGIALSSLFGVHIKRRPLANTESGLCQGIVLSMIERKNENSLREKTIFMEHPSEELCTSWEERIMTYIKSR